LGTVPGKLLLLDVAIAIFVCALAIQTSATRMMFSMARDRVLPFSTRLAKVSGRTGTPVAPTLVSGVIAAALLAVNIGNPALFLALTSVCIMLMYIAYLMVTVPMLVQRLRRNLPAGGEDETGRPLFEMGGWGLLVNVVAVLYGLGMAVNLGWPRSEVFDPQGGHWYLQWVGPIALGVTAVAGLLAYLSQRGEYHATLRATSPATTIVVVPADRPASPVVAALEPEEA
jgi:amino acid transporter